MAQRLMTETPSQNSSPILPSEKSQSTSVPAKPEPSIHEIITAARSQPAGSFGAVVCTFLTTVLLVVSFVPFSFAWLGWIALVPLIQLIRIERRTKSMYKLTYASGVLWSLIVFNWMRLGDATMFPAWIAISFYIGWYFLAFVGISRVAVHRFGVPLIAAVPFVWVGLEYARAHVITGCPWYFLGHTQYEWTTMIQVSDLFGAYSVSFLLALSAACVAGLIPLGWLNKMKLFPPVKLPSDYAHLPSEELAVNSSRAEFRRPWLNLGVALGVIALAFVYGLIRQSQADFQDGPRVALVQGNFPSSVKHDPTEYQRIYRFHEVLTGMSVQHQPDLIVWPETMFRWPLKVRRAGVSDADILAMAPPYPDLNQATWLESWKDTLVEDALHELSSKSGAALVIGLDALEARKDGLKSFNSAAFVTKESGLVDRYDKNHRVLFGEYVPLKKTLPWLHKLTPFPEDFGIEAGESTKVFALADWKLAPIICFEDTVPHLCRSIANDAEDGIDVFVNITNDGWFSDSAEQDQHLATAVFRSVENRTPMIRAVNTGVSAIIDGNGVIIEPDVMIDGDAQSEDEKRTTMRDPKTGRWHKGFNGAIVGNVPLDTRTSLYTRMGDVFGKGCCMSVIFFGCMGIFRRKKAAA
jgi:apolipoprotein N-acyltransferase